MTFCIQAVLQIADIDYLNYRFNNMVKLNFTSTCAKNTELELDLKKKQNEWALKTRFFRLVGDAALANTRTPKNVSV